MLSCDAAGSRHALRTRQLCCARRWLKAVSRSPTRPIAPPRCSIATAANGEGTSAAKKSTSLSIASSLNERKNPLFQ